MAYTVMMVAAAGGSTRMGQPKQHIALGRHPVLIHTLMTLQEVDAIDEILLIARGEDIPHFTALAAEAGVTKADIDAVAVTYGPGLIGALLVGVNFAKAAAMALDKPLIPVHHIRGHIAANYLAFPELQPHATIVGIHDGARPLVRGEDVAAVIAAAAEMGGAALAVPVKDTLKRTDEKGYITDTLHRGATRLHGEGVYTHDGKTILLTAVSRHQAVLLRNYIHEEDPGAFLIITTSTEIIGKGFRGVN